jgi:hypothetical protein
MLNGTCGSTVKAAAAVDTPPIADTKPDRQQI